MPSDCRTDGEASVGICPCIINETSAGRAGRIVEPDDMAPGLEIVAPDAPDIDAGAAGEPGAVGATSVVPSKPMALSSLIIAPSRS